MNKMKSKIKEIKTNKNIKSVSDIGFPKPKKVKCLFKDCPEYSVN